MHYVIGFLTALAGLLYALRKLQEAGVDLNAFNPYVWWRRRRLASIYGAKPLYVLDSPMEAAALLMLATAKCEGEVSREQKRHILNAFVQEFRLSVGEASALLSQSAFLLRDEEEIASQLGKVLERSRPGFTSEQVESTLSMMQGVSILDGTPNASQAALINETKRILCPPEPAAGKWS